MPEVPEAEGPVGADAPHRGVNGRIYADSYEPQPLIDALKSASENS
jgi:hypothetical protein